MTSSVKTLIATGLVAVGIAAYSLMPASTPTYSGYEIVPSSEIPTMIQSLNIGNGAERLALIADINANKVIPIRFGLRITGGGTATVNSNGLISDYRIRPDELKIVNAVIPSEGATIAINTDGNSVAIGRNKQHQFNYNIDLKVYP